MRKREIKSLDRCATSEQEKAQATAKPGRTSYSKKSSKESSRSRRRSGKAGAITQNDILTSACNDERLFTRQEVSLIVRDRVKKLNDRIQGLELELSIKELEDNGKRKADA